jgi:hypothetical protein
VAVRKDSGSDPVAASAADASNLAATMPTTFPRASTSAPPELPGCKVAVRKDLEIARVIRRARQRGEMMKEEG